MSDFTVTIQPEIALVATINIGPKGENGTGGGDVQSVNSVLPDITGNITLVATDVGAVPINSRKLITNFPYVDEATGLDWNGVDSYGTLFGSIALDNQGNTVYPVHHYTWLYETVPMDNAVVPVSANGITIGIPTYIMNTGTANSIVLTPVNGGLINGLTSLVVPPETWLCVVYDGINCLDIVSSSDITLVKGYAAPPDLSGYSTTAHRHAQETITPDAVTYAQDLSGAEIAALPIGTRYWDADSQTTALKTSADTTLQDGEEISPRCKNGDAFTHLNGQPVYQSGGTGKRPVVRLADASDENLSYAMFLATQDVPNTGNGLGKYTQIGLVRDIPYNNIIASTDNYVDWVEGSQLFLSTELGKLTLTRPSAPDHGVCVGIISDKSGSNISINVHIDAGYELSEIHDVLITTPAAGEVIQRNAENTVWVNKTLAEAGIASSVDNTGDQEMLSAGVYTTPTVTNNAGTITVSSGVYAIYSTTDFTGLVKKYTVAGGEFVLTDEVYNYLVCKYNGGTPIVTVITDLNEINDSSVVPIQSIFRTGAFIHPTDWDSFAIGLANKINRYIRRTKRFTIESGLTLSSTPTRVINTTNGIVWAAGANSIPINAAVQGAGGVTTFFSYHSAGAWLRSTATTSYNNTQYDNGADLATLTAGRYAVNWVYRGVESANHIYYILGTGDYTLSQAQASMEPSKPSLISSHTVLIGRIIIQKNSNTPTQIDLVSTTTFATAGVVSHPDLISRDAVDQHPQSAITNLTSDLALKSPIASPTFTGTPTAPVDTDYTTARLRNVKIMSTTEVNAGGGSGGVPVAAQSDGFGSFIAVYP